MTANLSRQMRKVAVMERTGYVPEEAIPAKYFILKNSQIFHNIGSVRDELFETDPNLERSMTRHRVIEKMLVPYHKLYSRKTASTVQTILTQRSTKK